MTTNHHTPITTGAPANASTVNNPLGQLDSALTTTNTSLNSVMNSGKTIGAWIPLFNQTATALQDEFDVNLATITVDGIAATSCDHLIFKMLLRTNSTEGLDSLRLIFNEDTVTDSGNYYRQHLFGRGTTATPVNNLLQISQFANAPDANVNASSFVVVNMEVPFFNGSHHKMATSNYYAHTSTTLDGWVGQIALRWFNTAPITRIRFRTDNYPTHKFDIGSKIQVWGIKSLDVLTSGS